MANAYYQPGFLRKYRVDYVGGLYGRPERVPRIIMDLYESGFLFYEYAFPKVWIPHAAVVDFQLGDKDMAFRYRTEAGEEAQALFEMNDPRVGGDRLACRELRALLRQHGILDAFTKDPDPTPEPGVRFRADLPLATLTVYEDWCTVEAKKNAVNLLITEKFFNGTKKFFYADLTAVQFREPGALTSGYIEFEYAGAHSGRGSGAYISENSVTFDEPHRDLMREIYTYIDGRVTAIKRAKTAPTAALSPADELKKFKELLDDGVITQEEFDAKKKQLLEWQV